MAIRYKQEVHDFIRDHYKGTTTRDLVEMVNERFGTEFTDGKMRSYKKNKGFRNELPGGYVKGAGTKVFPKHVKDYIQENYKGVGPSEMTKTLNEKFGTEYRRGQIKSYYKNNKLNSGLTGRFEKGNVPPNKGRKGWYPPGCEKGWFPKGHVSIQYPVGTERLRSDGYVWVKIAEPNKWDVKQRVVWEKHNGTIPDGAVITFLDGDRTNADLSNLAMITNEVNLQLQRNNLRFDDADLTRAGIALATMKTVVCKKKKEIKK